MEKKWRILTVIRRPAVLGTGFGLLAGGLLLYGYFATPERLTAQFSLVLLLAVWTGLLVGQLYARRLDAWLFFVAAGLLVGAAAALDLFRSQLFADQFFVGAVTFAYFSGLGFLIGAVAELIRFLHKLTHRSKIRR